MSFFSDVRRIMGGRNMDRRKYYITTQIYQIAPRFSRDGTGIRFDEVNCDWVLIEQFAMPEKWKQRWTSLLIAFRTKYPETPPTGFFLNVKLGLQSGGWDPHLFNQAYHEAPRIPGWHWYCCLAQVRQSGGWQPAADPSEPDNL